MGILFGAAYIPHVTGNVGLDQGAGVLLIPAVLKLMFHLPQTLTMPWAGVKEKNSLVFQPAFER